MTTQPSFINIEYVGSPLMESTMWTPVLQTEHKKGGIGAILGIVASIAVPFLALPIASAVFGTATVLNSALTGAVLGAGTSALTGGNPLMGAVIGGIGAGASSYFAGNPFGFGNAPVTDAGGLAASQAHIAGGSQLPPVRPMELGGYGNVGYDAAGAVGSGQYAYNPSTMSDVYSIDGVQVDAFGRPAISSNAATALNANGTFSNTATVSNNASTAAGRGVFTAGVPVDYTGPVLQLQPNVSPGGLTPFYGDGFLPPVSNGFFGFGGVPSNVAKFVTDVSGNTYLNPAWQQAAAKAATTSGGFTDALIKGGVNVAGMLAGQLAPNPQQQIADKYAKELAELKQTDQAAYEVKKKEVEGLIASAKTMDPAYFGQQSGNAAKIAGTRGLMESFREMPMAGLRNPAFTSAESRRANIGIGQNVGTAYDQGYGTGLTARQTALTSAINQIPNTPTRYLDGLRSMANQQGTANTYGAQSATGYTNLFGSLARPFMTSQV